MRQGSGGAHRRRRIWEACVALGVAAAVIASVVEFGSSGGSSSPAKPLLGVLGFSGNYIPQERTASVGAATISVFWDQAETSPGTFDLSYLQTVNTLIERAAGAGFSVIVDPGGQYPPSWVFGLGGGTRFVDQYGDAFTGSAASGDDVANAVTDPPERAALGTYLAWLGSHLDLPNVFAVRQGGGPLGELRYPDASYDGHTNCFWAYDSSSQSSSGVLAYRPGTGTTAQAKAFLNRYNANLVSFGDWENAQYQIDFDKQILVLLPGWGERPGVVAFEETELLTDNVPEFNQGLDWPDLLSSLPDRAQSIAYTTYLDAPSFGSSTQTEDPADFLASLARSFHMRLGGENTGSDSQASLALTLRRAQAHQMQIVSWFDEEQLAAASQGRGRGPTFTDLADAAHSDL